MIAESRGQHARLSGKIKQGHLFAIPRVIIDFTFDIVRIYVVTSN